MIIFISGTITSGKSTIANLLQKEMPNTVVIEPDKLRDFMRWMPLEEFIPINLENISSLVKNFVKNDLNVVIPNPLSQKNYDFFIENLKNLNTEIYVFTLIPDEKELLKSNRGYKLNNWEKERIKYHKKIGLTNPKFGIKIYSTNQTPEETTEEILKLING